jgi:ribosomal protein S18 acetylase RimI-like enzyme
MNSQIIRLQKYLRYSAGTSYRTFPVPPFTVFLQANDPLIFFNYAIPDEPISADSGDADESLDLLKEVFVRENRTPRFEFIGEYAPELPTVLERAGFSEESCLPLMLCTPETLVMPPPIPGFTVRHLQFDSPVNMAIAHSRIAYIGFSGKDDWSADHEGGIFEEKMASIAKGMGLFVGYVSEIPVVVATYSVPYDGITEIGGVATLSEYRRRGLAGYITAVATAHAFANGVTLALLSAGDEGAGRVYERVGFQTGATAVAYIVKSDA